MEIQLFSTLAHRTLQSSLGDVEAGNYLLSWGRSFEARIYFVADLITQVVVTPIHLLRCSFGLIAAIYTWGSLRETFDSGCSDLSFSFHRAFFSSIGALFSPYLAEKWKEEDLFERSWSCVQLLFPNRVSLTKSGLSFGWTVKKA